MADISQIKLPSGDTFDLVDEKSGYITGMTILSYGSSTWSDFIEAYNAKKVVYCRASSNSNPATGSQTRLAFMAYVSNADNPTNVEFQYYRSVSSHTASQQGDQVYVYKLDKTAGWTVATREASVKVNTGSNDGIDVDYSSGAITIGHTNSITAQTTQAVYPIAYDAQGHITSGGTAVTVPTQASDIGAIASSEKGAASGVVPLDSNSLIDEQYLPSYVDDVIEGYYYEGSFYEDSAHTISITGETGKIYIDLTGSKSYRWSGTVFVEITSGGHTYTAGNGIDISAGDVISSENSNLVNGSATGSLRSVESAAESSSYTIGQYAFAEGSLTKASGPASHAEGFNTEALGNNSHAEGVFTLARGHQSHAEGTYTEAHGEYSHAEGYYCGTSGAFSHAQNNHTLAGSRSQTSIGEYNILDQGSTDNPRGNYAFIVGNGTSNNNRSNALTVDWDGSVDIASGAKYKINGVALPEQIELTQAQYDALTSAEKNNGNVYYITDGTPSGGGGGGIPHVELTQAEYDALTPAQKENGDVYFITDGDDTAYSGIIGSGELATNAKTLVGAVNELASKFAQPLFKTEQKTCMFTGSTYMHFPVPSITGYTCIGIIGWQAGGGYVAGYANFDFCVEIEYQRISISNTNYSSGYQVIANLLYIRNDLY